ncbi:MAG: hypothetical protein U9Q40_06540 [Campylobacterota bacterium]|nr:hypothetical protein [Campylobacterota bacterium]
MGVKTTISIKDAQKLFPTKSGIMDTTYITDEFVLNKPSSVNLTTKYFSIE